MGVYQIWENLKSDAEFVSAVQEQALTIIVYAGDWELINVTYNELFSGEIDLTRDEGSGELLAYPCFFGNTLTDLDPLRLSI